MEHELSKRIRGLLGQKLDLLIDEACTEGVGFLYLKMALEKALIVAAREQNPYLSKGKLAKKLGMKRTTLSFMLQKYGVAEKSRKAEDLNPTPGTT